MRAAGVCWFSMLDERQKGAVLAYAVRRKIKPGATVVRRGETASELYVVSSGRLKVAVANAKGTETTFDILGPEDVFGEVGLFSDGLRTADVKALEACDVYVLNKAEVLRALREEPQVAIVLLHVMAEQVNALSRELEDVAALDATTRFARSLLKLAERFGVEPVPSNRQVQLKLSQQDLADLVGVSRVFANGRLRAWQDEGILTHKNGRLTIHKMDGLRTAAGIGN